MCTHTEIRSYIFSLFLVIIAEVIPQEDLLLDRYCDRGWRHYWFDYLGFHQRMRTLTSH